MIIGIDVDCVLRDIIPPTLDWWEQVTGIRKCREDIDRWAFYECLDIAAVGLPLREFRRLWFKQRQIWRRASPISGAIDAITELHKLNEIVIVTYQPTYLQKIWALEWLDEHLRDMYESLVFTKRKSLVRADVLIDDGPHNFEGFMGKAILFSQPWNQNDNRHTRIYGWDDPVLFETLSSIRGRRK